MNVTNAFKYAKQASEVVNEAKRSHTGSDEVFHISIYVDHSASKELIGWVKDAFVPEGEACSVTVEAFGAGERARVHAATDVAVVISGGDEEDVADLILGFTEDGVPCAVLAQSSVEVPDIEARIPEGSSCALITATSRETLLDKLSSWLVSSFENSHALASSFEFVRDAKATQLIAGCTVENALLGALGTGSAAAMPLMTANQARMAFELTSIYGHTDVKEQVPLIATVIGAGVVWRGLARAISKKVPGLGLIVRVGVAMGGTVVSGKAVQAGLGAIDSLAARELETSTELAV